MNTDMKADWLTSVALIIATGLVTFWLVSQNDQPEPTPQEPITVTPDEDTGNLPGGILGLIPKIDRVATKAERLLDAVADRGVNVQPVTACPGGRCPVYPRPETASSGRSRGSYEAVPGVPRVYYSPRTGPVRSLLGRLRGRGCR